MLSLFVAVLAELCLLTAASPLGPSSWLPRDTNDRLNPYPSHPRLTFASDGSFKLAVLSDLHFGEARDTDWGPQQDVNSTSFVNTLLDHEKPDIVVFDGDQITGENTFSHNVTDNLDKIFEPLIQRGIPWASTYGNHDHTPAKNLSHARELEYEQRIAPKLAYTRPSAPGVGGDDGVANYWVPVFGNGDDDVPELLIWMFDSRSSIAVKELGDTVQRDDWVHETVGPWVTEEAAALKKAWGRLPPGIAFVHIPPSVELDMQENGLPDGTLGLNDDKPMSVQSEANSGTPTGADTEWYDALTTAVTNLFAIVSGHDHGNEWCAIESTKKTRFCFAKHSGHGGYNREWGWGSRVFSFEVGKLSQSVETWITMQYGPERGRQTLRI